MSIGAKTRKMLWGRAANRCAFSNCKIELVMDETETDDESVIGDEAHIIAQQPDGPRGDATFPIEKIDKYGNLILLCKIHHKQVDDQFNTYTHEVLTRMKKEHESWVNQNLSYDKQKQLDDEIYASYLDDFNNMSDVDNWNNWMSYIFADDTPSMTKVHYNSLKKLRDYLLNRIWPKRYPELETAFLNFRLIISDFLLVFSKYKTDEWDKERWSTKKFYKIQWNPEKFDKLSDMYDYHEELILDFACELTRATNFIHEQIRKYLIPSYRIKEGVLLISSGLNIDFKYRTYRLEYSDTNKKTLLYKGLRDFMKIRKDRDVFFGKGLSKDYNDI